MLQLHLSYQLNTWLQRIERRQLQEDTRNIWVLEFGANYTRGFTVGHHMASLGHTEVLTKDTSTLVEVMGWCRQAINHYLHQSRPISWHHMKSRRSYESSFPSNSFHLLSGFSETIFLVLSAFLRTGSSVMSITAPRLFPVTTTEVCNNGII